MGMFGVCTRANILFIYSGIVTILFFSFILFKQEREAGKYFVTTIAATTWRLHITPKPNYTLLSPTSFSNSTPGFYPTTLYPRKWLNLSCADYVIFSNGFANGRGLGNQIFNLAAGSLVAQLTGRKLAANNSVCSPSILEETFDHTYERFNSTCHIHEINDRWNLAYNPDVETLDSKKTKEFDGKTITIGGYFQSWKYAINEKLLRSRYLNIKSGLKEIVNKYFDSILPPGWRPDTFTRVGIHVRRGDVLRRQNINFGYTTPEVSYFKKAMHHMLSLYKRVQFIVITNDQNWTRTVFTSNMFGNMNLTSVAFNIAHSPAINNRSIDFSITSLCHHTIMSTGTFGWWGAWLARGTTIYYKDWPKPGSPLDHNFKRDEFFPPSWIGMSN